MGKKIMYIANVGDTKTVLYGRGITKVLSYEHKAQDEKEVKRVK